MTSKQGLILKLLKMITYKDVEPVKEFYIPTVEELTKNKKNKNPATSMNLAQENSTDNENVNTPDSSGINIASSDTSKSNEKAVSTSIDDNIDYIKSQFNAPTNKDIIIRCFLIGEKHKAFITYLDGMVDKQIVNNYILRPIFNNEKLNQSYITTDMDCLLISILETNYSKKVTLPQEAIFEILSGNTLLYLEGCSFYISSETKGYPARGVEKPLIENVVTGSQEAFNENLRTNISLVRKNMKNKNLTTEFIKIGSRNQNQCAIMYINGLVNPAIVDEVKRRMKKIDVDFSLGDGMLEQFIEDNTFSIIPTILTTERPDRTCSHLSEGKVAIFSEGTPFAKIVPITISALIHSPEDSLMRFPYGTLLRFIRVFGIFIATLLPALYVALTNFHQEMIPTDLLIAIAKAKENVPFPTVVEVILMELSFELIREAGIRVPGIIGNTLGIIGALILGQAAVTANIVSPILIIIVAVTGLGNFAVPNFNLGLSIRLIRFTFIIAGALLGFYGITCLLTLYGIYFTSQKTFGIPLFSPIAPRMSKSKDLIIRHPIWKQEHRPDSINPLDVERQPQISRKWTLEDPNYSYEREGEDD